MSTPRLWPFKQRTPPRVAVVRLDADSASPDDDFPVLTVGQSRLTESFSRLGFTAEDEPRLCSATLTPIVDPNLQRIADITVSVDGQVVGYLRSPDLNRASALMDDHHADALVVPCRMFWSPAGPEVNLRLP